MSEKRPRNLYHLLQYSLLALPLAFAGLPIYVHAPEFYASELGVSITALGLVLLCLRVIDAVQDPLIGGLCDRFHHRRVFIILMGMIFLVGGFWILFHPGVDAPLIWFGLGILLCTTGFSTVSINFHTLGGLWRADSFERTRITSWRESVGLIGLLLASVAPSLLGSLEDAAGAFHWLSLLYIPLLMICGIVFFAWLRGASFERPSLSEGFVPFSRLYTRWNIEFFGIYVLNMFASAIPAVLVLFFINDRLDAEALTGLFLLLYFLSGACGMPLWPWLARRVGKERGWLLSMWLAAITFIWAFFLSAGDIYAYGLVCILSGLALGADLALPPSIIADHIDRRRDQEAATRYFALLTFLSKSALALATGLTLPVLGLLGYQPGAVADYGVTDYLSYAYALIPCLLKVGVSFWLWRFIGRGAGGVSSYESGALYQER